MVTRACINTFIGYLYRYVMVYQWPEVDLTQGNQYKAMALPIQYPISASRCFATHSCLQVSEYER